MLGCPAARLGQWPFGSRNNLQTTKVLIFFRIVTRIWRNGQICFALEFSEACGLAATGWRELQLSILWPSCCVPLASRIPASSLYTCSTSCPKIPQDDRGHLSSPESPDFGCRPPESKKAATFSILWLRIAHEPICIQVCTNEGLVFCGTS